MSEQSTADVAPSDGEAAPRSGRLLLLALAGAGLAIGAGGGFVLFAPKAHPAAASGTHTAGGEDAPEPGAEDTAGKERVMVSLENIVVNPAATNGTRFLLVSAAFQVRDAATETSFRAHELEIRDRVVAFLGSKTITELTNPVLRDTLKAGIMSQIAPLFPQGTVERVHFPQFVIQ